MRFLPLSLLLVFLAYHQYGDGLAKFIRRDKAPMTVAKPSLGSDDSSYTPNYLGGPLMQASRRWKDFPVRVYFEKSGAYSADRRDAALQGFSFWATVSKGTLPYVVVDAASEADVTVRFIPGAYIPPSRSTVGLTRSLSSEKWIRSAQMTLATGGRTTLANLTDVAAHEWGHALGINGHSDDPKDLMSATSVRVITLSPRGRVLGSESKVRTPTRRDINTMKTIYTDRFQTAERN
jgi:predicted Zn-dependent protease